MSKIINNKLDLRRLYRDPKKTSLEKTQYKLDADSHRFIAASPFLILGTHGDVSPRGDYLGFVKVSDDNTVIIPDRKWNNRLDSMSNILTDPIVALIFLIPGINEKFRIRGEAEITTDPALLEPLSIKNLAPNSGLLIHVREAYIHCAKAILRSNLWNEDARQDGLRFGATKIFAAHVKRDYDQYSASYNEDIKLSMAEEGRGKINE